MAINKDGRPSTKIALLFVSLFLVNLVVGLSRSPYETKSSHDDDDQHIMTEKEKSHYKDKVVEMFKHAYNSYLKYAYPADELMPLSCKGRFRGSEPLRGDIDDSLGNFTLTLIDTLDSLVVLGMLDEFGKAVEMVITDVTFDTDVVVSVFETNIRILGGLLGAHFVAIDLQRQKKAMMNYNGELLKLAKDIGNRLLPAFNTTTGIPYPRVNLRHGIDLTTARTGHEKDTCTSCAGTMILEFAALSRLTGDPIYENRARRAMDFLWKQRHRASDLVGTVINIHNGNWVRRESGVGAGIDSYYEYMFKTYVLLGDEVYRDRFNTHYDAVMKYVSQGPLLVDVHMHRPEANSRNFMDSLLAFWPGLQVLKGDIRAAIETHEILYQVVKRHNFLPEAFTTNFRVHWGQHPLRPEFVESTYFLYKATGDPYYLGVGRKVVENMENHARVRCGYAAIKDVTYSTHEDQMDSYVLAETFKYLYLLFSNVSDLHVDIDQYIFTTEAHLLPLSLAIHSFSMVPLQVNRSMYSFDDDHVASKDTTNKVNILANENTCPNSHFLYKGDKNYARNLRAPLRNLVNNANPRSNRKVGPILRARDFNAGDNRQLVALQQMGIRLQTMADGRVQLLHTTSQAVSQEHANDGMRFMQEMIEISKSQQQHALPHEPLYIEIISPKPNVYLFEAGPAQFGYDLKNLPPVEGRLSQALPALACDHIENMDEIKGNIAIVVRGGCMFVDKARNIQKAGAVGGIVIDATVGSSNAPGSSLFAMSGDGTDDVNIPLAFLYHWEGTQLRQLMELYKDVTVSLYYKPPENHASTSSPNKPQPQCSLPVTPDSQMSHYDSIKQPTRHELEKLVSSFLNKDRISIKQTNTEAPPKTSSLPKRTLDSITSPKVTISTNQKGKPLDTWDSIHGNQLISINSDTSKSGTFSMTFSAMNSERAMIIVSYPSQNLKSQFFFKQGDNNNQFIFTLYHKMALEKPALSDIYTAVIKLLKDHTNFASLPQQPDFLLCLAQGLEAAYFTFSDLDRFTQHMFSEFLSQLDVKDDSSMDGNSIDEASVESESSHKRTIRDLSENEERKLSLEDRKPDIPDFNISSHNEDVKSDSSDANAKSGDVVTDVVYTDDISLTGGIPGIAEPIAEENMETAGNKGDDSQKQNIFHQSGDILVENSQTYDPDLQSDQVYKITKIHTEDIKTAEKDKVIIEDSSIIDEVIRDNYVADNVVSSKKPYVEHSKEGLSQASSEQEYSQAAPHNHNKFDDLSEHDEL